jgi:hypothetical protein
MFGMFDRLHCRYKLKNSDHQKLVYQTKDLDGFMGDFTITRDGRLIEHESDHITVPEKERPYYGTQEWEDNPICHIFGSIKKIYTGNKVIDYHGKVHFYTIVDDELVEYEAVFTHGKVEYIIEVKEEREK